MQRGFFHGGRHEKKVVAEQQFAFRYFTSSTLTSMPFFFYVARMELAPSEVVFCCFVL
jgi:hypothetical protein